jgi:7-cyano-7-deazaguanine synthase
MNLPHDTALVVLSGGQDSTTCLFRALRSHTEVHALTFNYGQRHICEIAAANKVARMAGVATHEVLPLLPGTLHSTSPLVSDARLEQYADHHSLPGGIEKTFVPMRNQLFLTLAANRAVECGADYIYTGVCEEDYGGYPDCRREFIDALETAINLSNGRDARRIHIITPLMRLTKAKTVQLALMMPGCYEALAFTHTAYDGIYPPTGHDHATLLRAKGFEEADTPDPLVLRAYLEGAMELPTSANYRCALVDAFIPRIAKLLAPGVEF